MLTRVADKKKPASYDELLDAWSSWHATSKEMRPYYERLVTLSNEGAKEFGSADLGDLWRSAYDMPPADFEKETDRLWNQVKPLYDELHCYVRGRLSKKFGADKVAGTGPIPAHVLGNMWAQEWTNIYPLVELGFPVLFHLSFSRPAKNRCSRGWPSATGAASTAPTRPSKAEGRSEAADTSR